MGRSVRWERKVARRVGVLMKVQVVVFWVLMVAGGTSFGMGQRRNGKAVVV